MPSEKKRINLTVSDNVYEKIEKYRDENGFASDASACLQLIVKQLKAAEESELFLQALKEMPKSELIRISQEGMEHLKTELDKPPKK